MTLIGWSAWALATATGLILIVMRTAENAFTTVSLPRLLYLMWLMVCVLVLVAMRHVAAASVGLLFAAFVGALTFMSEDKKVSRRRGEIAERLRGAREALKEEPNNGLAMELLGDVSSTLEDRASALKWYEKAYAFIPNAKLLEKIENLKRTPPSFYIWGNVCAHELRLCPACETLCERDDYSCSRCGETFFSTPGLWWASRFNRVCDEYGLTEALESGVFLLPFLFVCGPMPYGFAWLVWAAARRPRQYSAR